MDENKSLAAYFYELSYIISNPGPGTEDDDNDNQQDSTDETSGDDQDQGEDNEQESSDNSVAILPVQGFGVYDIGDSKLWLVWKNPTFEGFAGVKIYRSEGQLPTKWDDGVLVYQGLGEEHIDKNVPAKKSYFYSIAAFAEGGENSEPSIYHIALDDRSTSDNEVVVGDGDDGSDNQMDENQEEDPPAGQEDDNDDQSDYQAPINPVSPDDTSNDDQAQDSSDNNTVLEATTVNEDQDTTGIGVSKTEIVEVKNQNSAIDLLEKLKPLVLGISNNPQLKAVNKVVAPVLILSALANVFSAFSLFNLLAYLRYFFSQPASLLYRYKRRKWGVVYNALTKQPIDLAIVRLYSKGDNRLVQSAVTDKFGRYHLLTEPGEYYLTVVKPGYNFPTQFLGDQDQDISYLDLYHGKSIQIKDNQNAINQNIPIDPEEKVVPSKNILLFYYLRKIQKIFAFSAVVLALVSLIIDPGKTTAIFFAIHLTLFGLFYRLGFQKMPKSWGRVYDLLSKKPLGNAIVRIYDKKYNKLLETRVANKSGNYAFLVNNNLFYLTAEKPGFNQYKSQDIDLIGKKDQSMVAMDIGLAKG